MPITAAVFPVQRLEPFLDPDDIVVLNFKLPNSVTYARGTVVGELSATPGTAIAYNSAQIAAGAAPVLSDGGVGALGAGTYNVGYTYKNASGETVISALAAITIAASHQINVAAVTPLPAGATSVNWYMTTAGGLILFFISNNNGAAFTINALPAVGAVQPPAVSTGPVAADGSAIPRGLLMYDCVSDGSGNITLGAQIASEFGESVKGVPVYVRGYFKTEDLTGLDAFALTQPGFILKQGSLSSGILRLA